jgi:hypothetical protein
MSDTNKYPFLKFESLLSAEDQMRLSGSAKLLYAFVWNRMHNKDADRVSLRDDKASEMARVPLALLAQIQAELAATDLMQSSPDGESKIPGQERTRYVYIDQVMGEA